MKKIIIFLAKEENVDIASNLTKSGEKSVTIDDFELLKVFLKLNILNLKKGFRKR